MSLLSDVVTGGTKEAALGEVGATGSVAHLMVKWT
jgi:hypothetical protein